MSVAPKELKLCSPVGAEAIIYHWPLCRVRAIRNCRRANAHAQGRSYNGAVEIMETIKLVCNDCPELRVVTEKMTSTEVDFSSYESMKTLCDKFNKAAVAYKNLNKGTAKLVVAERASTSLLRHIVQQVYNRSVTEPEKLNSYEPFTPAVYGETSFDLISKMIDIVKPNEDDMFIDLGSGVGQVVAQVAGGAKCKKCIGIEKAEVPAAYARTVEYEFRKWMKWYGKSYSDFEIIEGDFLDRQHRETINKCSIIFVNNFAFGPEVDHKLKEIFAEMHDGTKIISSKAFCPLNFRISDRNLSDIGTIMNVSELWSQTGSVSWTDKPVTYYLHIIDRTKLEGYFASMRNNGGGNGSRPELRRSGSKASCQSWSSRDSGSSNAEFPTALHHIAAAEDQEKFESSSIVVGTTTRRQYATWLAEKEKQRKVSQPQMSTTKQPSVFAKRMEESVNSPIVQATVESSSEHEDDRENEDVDDEDQQEEQEDDAEESSGDEDEDGAEKRNLSTSQDSFRRPGRPRKSQATLKAQQAKKKYQKQRRPPGRPTAKKSPKRKTHEWLGVLDMFHQQIVSGAASTSETRAPLTAITDQSVPFADQGPSSLETNAMPKNCEAPLDEFVDRMRKEMQAFLGFMTTPQYRANVMESIERENARKHNLEDRRGQLERQIARLQDEGVQMLRSRMTEVGIQAETPAELLNKAKEIVMDHQALQNRVNGLDLENRNLERHNEYLVNDFGFSYLMYHVFSRF